MERVKSSAALSSPSKITIALRTMNILYGRFSSAGRLELKDRRRRAEFPAFFRIATFPRIRSGGKEKKFHGNNRSVVPLAASLVSPRFATTLKNKRLRAARVTAKPISRKPASFYATSRFASFTFLPRFASFRLNHATRVDATARIRMPSRFRRHGNSTRHRGKR